MAETPPDAPSHHIIWSRKTFVYAIVIILLVILIGLLMLAVLGPTICGCNEGIMSNIIYQL